MLFNLNAKHYRNHSEPQYQRAHDCICREDFKKTDRVLDIGCGDGRITAEIAQWVTYGKVIGIDASPSMIQLAQISFPPSRFHNLEFQIANAEEFSFPEQFNKIICFSCLLWIRKAKEALHRMCSLLKPEGELFILTYLKNSSVVNFLEKTLEAFPEYQRYSVIHTMLSTQDHRDILLSHNFELEKFEIKKVISSFHNQDDLRNYVKGWLNCYVNFPETVFERFLNQAIINSSAYSYSTESHPINLPFESLIIKAKKRKD
jgi:ubiquinone/menaquinone biosynthesis C-methylase UbiE